MSYLGNNTAIGSASRTPYEITATQGQTAFTTGGYSASTVEVLRNGTRLAKADYTATDGVTVTLARACAAGDVVTVVPNTEFGVAASYTKAEADALFAEPNQSNAWTVPQAPAGVTLTDGPTINWDGSIAQHVTLTLGGNRTLNFSNMVPRATYVLQVLQDATGGRSLAFGSNFYFAGGVAPTLTSTAGAIDVFTFVAGANGVALHCIGQLKNSKPGA